MSSNFTLESSPADAQALFDAIDVTLGLDDAMPQKPDDVLPDPFGIEGAEFHADPRTKVDLIPIEGLKRFIVERRADVPDRATVFREVHRPDLGPEAYEVQAFRLHKEADGTPAVTMASNIHISSNEPVYLGQLLAAQELEDLTGGDRVPAVVSQEVARQVSSTRVHPIQPNDDF